MIFNPRLLFIDDSKDNIVLAQEHGYYGIIFNTVDNMRREINKNYSFPLENGSPESIYHRYFTNKER